MTWSRKSALLMLAMTVFWTAVPASACLLAMPTTGQHSCCRAMTMELACAPAGTTANRSCCQVGRQDPAVPPVPLSTSKHSQRLAYVPNQAALQAPTSQSAACRNALEAPPPKSSPGGISILRI
ncbi:MAG: hypothetical protein WCA11_05135 [Terracidiphilus sp.]